MKTGDLMKHLFFILLILEGSAVMATEQDNTPPPPPAPPAVPATPNTTGQANTHNTQHHFTDNDQNISMQIIGATPDITDPFHARLDFANGSYLHVAIQAANNAEPMVIRWDSSGCVATQAGKSKPCGKADRERIINLIRQLPTPPVPPSR